MSIVSSFVENSIRSKKVKADCTCHLKENVYYFDFVQKVRKSL